MHTIIISTVIAVFTGHVGFVIVAVGLIIENALTIRKNEAAAVQMRACGQSPPPASAGRSIGCGLTDGLYSD